jgi:parallel beta-helix repeat protein
MMDGEVSRLILNILVFLCFILNPVTVSGKILVSDTIWRGEVSVSEDVLVPEGVTLTITPGTVIKVTSPESTKTDPEYLSPMTEITIRGTLQSDGKRNAPIIFRNDSETDERGGWAGILIDGGSASLSSCRIQGAETGIYVIKGTLVASDSVFRENRYGLVAEGPKTKVNIKNTRISENDYGLFIFNGAQVDHRESVIENNGKKNIYSADVKKHPFKTEYSAVKSELSRQYSHEILVGDTIWQGRIAIDGAIRVPEGARLIILPGTLIEINRRDENGDGIGENGLLIQGLLVAKGTKERPIVFRSAEKDKRRGDWDAINIMNSDGVQNLVEYCQIEDAYRGIHFHFSNIAIRESVLKNNYRALQFQESTAEITGNQIYGNTHGIQARDSEITFANNAVFNNVTGANFFRSSVNIRNNTIANNLKEGLRVREGIPTAEANVIDSNRYGLMVSDSVYGKFNGNVITHNIEAGVSLKGTDAIEVSENYIQANGLNGISIQGSAAVIRGNVISQNGERGIGITSFNGTITGNNILENGRYALGNDGGSDVSAPLNWWGGADLRKVVYDKEADPRKGRVNYSPITHGPIMFTWPLGNVAVDCTWYGDIKINGTVTVPSGHILAISPRSHVFFAKGAGLKISGKITAIGKHGERISFSSTAETPGDAWDEILLDHATGSVFFYCDFTGATWSIHSHFTNLFVSDCTFTGNYGGIRFQSGPVEIHRSVFDKNTVGLRAFRGSAVIKGNSIMRNEIGIFVRERGGGLTIKDNNIVDNLEYGIRSGDFNTEDINAASNWWGRVNPVDAIYDGRKEPGIGMVRFEPRRAEPFEIDVREGK